MYAVMWRHHLLHLKKSVDAKTSHCAVSAIIKSVAFQTYLEGSMRIRQLFGVMAKRGVFPRTGAVAGLVRSLLLGAGLFLTSGKAEAVPAFAAQTGQHCTACHVGGFGPQLTPLGREFKLEGYTMRSGTDFTAPISAMAVASYLQTAKDVAFPPAPNFGSNNNVALDKLSLFLAGGYG